MKSSVHNKGFLICLAGLPASGKTIFAFKLKILLEKRLGKSVVKIIDPDKIRKDISPKKFNYKKEPKVRLENLEAIQKALKNEYIVISDDLNYYSSMRHDLKKIADDLDLSFFIIHIATPLEKCIKWNKKRGAPIPNKIIKKVHNKFDYFNKYQWDQPEAEYDLSRIKNLDDEIEKLIDIFLKKSEISDNSLKKGEHLKHVSNLNKINLDKITRIYVGIILQEPNYAHLKNKIIKLRKRFIKLNKVQSLKDVEISRKFRKYLEKNLNIKISKELF